MMVLAGSLVVTSCALLRRWRAGVDHTGLVKLQATWQPWTVGSVESACLRMQ